MSPSAHAKLSPSSADRWLSCPASIRLEAALPKGHDEDSVYAREGTLAHALAEIEASYRFKIIDRAKYQRGRRAWLKQFRAEKYPEGTYEEMQAHVKDFLEHIAEEMAKFPGSQLMLEQRMDSGVPACWGTSDVVIFSPTHVQIIDLKYGAGVKVYARDNNQLRLYALGALDTYGDFLGTTELIIMSIFQPRMDDAYSSWEQHPDELRQWREEVAIPGAEIALNDPDAPFGPSEKACRWCPFAGTCKARAEASALEDFGDPFVDEPEQIPVDPALMTPEQIGQVLARIPQIKSWCEAVEKAALQMAYSEGTHIPGYKVIKSGGKRSIPDPEAAIKKLTEAGYDEDEVSVRKARTLGELETLVGKKKLPDVLGDLLKKGEGKESLVSEDDPRPAITPASQAALDFGEEFIDEPVEDRANNVG